MSETCAAVVHFMNVACLDKGHGVKNCDTLKQWAVLGYNIPFICAGIFSLGFCHSFLKP